MADTKITSLLTPQVTTNPATDVLPIVNIADTSMASSGSTRKITVNTLLGAGGTATLASATITGAATVGTTLGVTGVSTLASATITGDLTVDTSTLKVDSGNDRVGIGTATPAAKLIVRDGANRNLLVSSDAAQLGSAGVAIGSFTDNAAGYAPLSIIAGTSIGFGINGSTAMTLNASGNLVFPSGKGIDFSATTEGSGTMTSELLNDYEEGTWTGTLKGSTTDPTTPVTATGRYTKIGRQVTVQIWFFNANTTGASGEVSVAGLPFTNATGITAVPGSVSSSSLVTFTGTLISQIGNGASIFELYSVNSNANATNATHNAGTSRSLALSSTYQVA